MKTIIAGCRDFTDYKRLIHAVFDAYYHDFPMITEVVSGGAAGVDAMGERFAVENEMPLKLFSADWNKHGKAAGPIRNRQMAKYADALLALWDGKSRGTKNMIETAQKEGLRVHIYRIDEKPI